MHDDLANRLQKAKEHLQQRDSLRAKLDEAGRLLAEEGAKVRAFAALVEREKADVDRLQGLSLAAIFETVFGNIDEQRLQEQKEFLAAKLKLDSAQAAIPLLETDVERRQAELNSLGNVEGEYEAVLAEKQRLLRAGAHETSAAMFEAVEKMAELKMLEKELEQAVSVGEKAYAALHDVSNSLRSAAHWGTFDMFAGGAMATMLKHSNLDTARAHVTKAQQLLLRFREELADAGNRLSVSLEIDGLSTFADFFFDGLIVDWLVQSKINEAAACCGRVQAEVSSAIDTCRRRLEETTSQHAAVDQRRREIIEAAS